MCFQVQTFNNAYNVVLEGAIYIFRCHRSIAQQNRGLHNKFEQNKTNRITLKVEAHKLYVGYEVDPEMIETMMVRES